MKPSIAAKLAQLSNRLQEINELLARETATADLDAYRRLTREHAEITPVVELYAQYVRGEEDITTAEEMVGDPAMREFAESEIKATRERLSAIEADGAEEAARIAYPAACPTR